MIKVDPTKTEEGCAHYGEIHAIDVNQPDAGSSYVPEPYIHTQHAREGEMKSLCG